MKPHSLLLDVVYRSGGIKCGFNHYMWEVGGQLP